VGQRARPRRHLEGPAWPGPEGPRPRQISLRRGGEVGPCVADQRRGGTQRGERVGDLDGLDDVRDDTLMGSPKDTVPKVTATLKA
jgi:hypothetical protein